MFCLCVCCEVSHTWNGVALCVCIVGSHNWNDGVCVCVFWGHTPEKMCVCARTWWRGVVCVGVYLLSHTLDDVAVRVCVVGLHSLDDVSVCVFTCCGFTCLRCLCVCVCSPHAWLRLSGGWQSLLGSLALLSHPLLRQSFSAPNGFRASMDGWGLGLAVRSADLSCMKTPWKWRVEGSYRLQQEQSRHFRGKSHGQHLMGIRALPWL